MIRIGREVHKFARNSGGHNAEKMFLNMAQEARGSDNGSNSFQSMEQRRTLACSKSARWYSQTL